MQVSASTSAFRKQAAKYWMVTDYGVFYVGFDAK